MKVNNRCSEFIFKIPLKGKVNPERNMELQQRSVAVISDDILSSPGKPRDTIYHSGRRMRGGAEGGREGEEGRGAIPPIFSKGPIDCWHQLSELRRMLGSDCSWAHSNVEKKKKLFPGRARRSSDNLGRRRDRRALTTGTNSVINPPECRSAVTAADMRWNPVECPSKRRDGSINSNTAEDGAKQ